MPSVPVTEPCLHPAAVTDGDTAFVALLVALFLLVHTLWTSFGFLLHYYDAANRSPEDVASVASYLRAWAAEWWYSFAATLGYPLAWLPLLGDPLYDPHAGPPIVLVHGYGTNRSLWFPLAWRLRRYGYQNVFLVRLGALSGGVEEVAAALHPRLQQIQRCSGGAPLVCICHSVGGLVMRACAMRPGSVSIAKLICLATPHRGTRLAAFAPGAARRDLSRRSALLKELRRTAGPELVSLYSVFDNFVLPARSADYGIRSYAFDSGGHGALVYDRDAFEVILRELPAIRG